jgi:hypothetical protein
MGTILRNSAKWNFQRLQGIQEAYERTFTNSESEIKRIFGAQGLRWLSAVRNLLVHRAGRADQQFCWQMKDHARLKELPPDGIIQFDAPMVKELVAAAADSGIALVEFVNRWLTANPQAG